MLVNTLLGGNTLGSSTQTAGTVITVMVPPSAAAIARIIGLSYTAAGTAHTLTILKERARTTTSAAAAAGQAVINLTSDPGSIAANDYLAWENTDGTFSFGVVSSVATLAITMTANLPSAVSSGAVVWFFGVTTDTLPQTGLAHPTLPAPASATTVHVNDTVGVAAAHLAYSPLLVQSNNATNAGTLNYVSYGYFRR